MYLLRCKNCGKIYKAIKEQDGFITDFGDKLTNCFCNGDFDIIQTEYWIADLVFKIKGN